MNDRAKEILDKAKDLVKDHISEDIEKVEFNSLDDIVKNIKIFYDIVKKVVAIIEVAGSDTDEGKDKLEAAVKIIDDMIKLPWWMEPADGPIIKIVLSMMVNFLNQQLSEAKSKFNSSEAAKLLNITE